MRQDKSGRVYLRSFKEYCTTSGLVLRCCLLLLILVTFQRELLYLTDKIGPDFNQDYRMAESLVAGKPVYHRSFEEFLALPQDKHAQAAEEAGTGHPPSTGVFFIPLLLFDFHTAYMVNAALGMCLVSLAVLLTLRSLGCSSAVSLLLVLGSLYWGPNKDGFEYGQVAPLLSSLVIFTWLADRAGKPALAGTLLGLAGAMKFYPLLGVVYFAAKRKWKSLFYTFAVFSVVLLLSIVLAGLDGWLMYFKVVGPYNIKVWTGFPPVISLSGWLMPLINKTPWSDPLVALPWLVSIVPPALILSGAGICFLMAYREKQNSEISFLGVMAAMCLLAPVAHPHGCLLLAPLLFTVIFKSDLALPYRLLSVVLLLLGAFTQTGWWQIARDFGLWLGYSKNSLVVLYMVKLHAVICVTAFFVFWHLWKRELGSEVDS